METKFQVNDSKKKRWIGNWKSNTEEFCPSLETSEWSPWKTQSNDK